MMQAWRRAQPDITLRSTFIVGFPGETDDDFEALLDFLHEAQLDRVGCFQYSAVAGAAANQLAGAVPDDVKLERWERFMETQAEISAARLAQKIGREMTVLVDSIEDEMVLARSSADAPEIDGQVRIDGAAHLSPGDMVRVRIIDSDDYDLDAELLD